jgi:hypothetical protein
LADPFHLFGRYGISAEITTNAMTGAEIPRTAVFSMTLQTRKVETHLQPLALPF